MSVLRRAKLRTPDGTESIEYPLGVEAENVEVANGENLSQRLARIDEDLEKNEEDIAAVSELAGRNKQNIGANEIRIDALERRSASVDKKPYYFDTVADMKAYQKLKVGDMAITLGYYEKNDGGGATYCIRSKNNSDVEDNMTIYFVGNNLVAELVKDNIINILQLGAKADGVSDDTEIINFAFNNYDNVEFPEKFNIIWNGKCQVNHNLTINGNNSTIIINDAEEHNVRYKTFELLNNKNLLINNLSFNVTLPENSFSSWDWTLFFGTNGNLELNNVNSIINKVTGNRPNFL